MTIGGGHGWRVARYRRYGVGTYQRMQADDEEPDVGENNFQEM